jgi:SAM-dependent methyltransferase
MNPGLPDTHASIAYYDGDYPSKTLSLYPENFDDVVAYQGVANDVERYIGLAIAEGAPVLELCCGTGRVAIPIARAGMATTAVDISNGMLETFRTTLGREEASVRALITLSCQDIRELSLPRRDYRFCFFAFNSLLCIPTFEGQLAALKAAASHLAPGGLLAVDAVNPLKLKLEGNPVPVPFFTRINPRTGNHYTRFAMSDPVDIEQCQRLHGWYDEVGTNGQVTRSAYSLQWRPIFRHELELMLRFVGLEIEAIEGGHLREPLTAQSSKLFVLARKPI